MTEPDWTLWRSFLAVLRSGSLSQAARDLALTQPTLGRHISLLEEALGAGLFTRSKDGLKPTDRALSLRDEAERMAASAELLGRIASGEAAEAAGRVRMTASEFMAIAVLPPLLAAFRARFPAVILDLAMSDRTLDLLRGDADLAVRNAEPRQGALIARRMGAMPVQFFAHRSYAEKYGVPTGLEGLSAHALIGRQSYEGRIPALAGLPLRFAFTSESDAALLAALKAGLGIGPCQRAVAAADPSLLPVLPDLVLAEVPIWLAMHEDRSRLRRVRLLFDHLAEGLTHYLAGAR